MSYEVVPLFPVFGRLVSEAEVEELVPLVLLDGGPRDGWVYDGRDIPRRTGSPTAPRVHSVRYEYLGEVAQLEDGRLCRLYGFVFPDAGNAQRGQPPPSTLTPL